MTDRTYWSAGGAWHALDPERSWGYRPGDDGPLPVGEAPLVSAVGYCGRHGNGEAAVPPGTAELSDRVPADGHLCGNCSRVIASQTDAR